MRRWSLRLLRVASLALSAALAVIHFTPLVPWIAHRLAGWDPEPRGGVLIVLGAEQQADGSIGLTSYWRCYYAARLWRQGSFSAILVSGGSTLDEPSEAPPLAQTMRDFLVSLGVPKDSISLETTSSSTRGNAIYSVPILQRMKGPFTLITSDFHSFRARRAFRRLGLEVQSWPAPDVLKQFNTWSYRLHCAALLAEEGVKIVTYYWRGWI